MIKIIKKINKYLIKNKKNILSIFIISIFFVFIVVKPVEAKLPTLAGGISSLLGWICAWIIAGIGYLLTFLIKILVNVANFNNIIDVPAVKNGWVVVRDLCNMFFVLILLIIAFATILKQENYSAKRLLPKLLIMAVLINFSRTIFGLIIDFSQVIMSSFVSGFGGKNASAYIIDAFQINKMQSINDNVSGVDVGTWGTSIAVLLGLVAILIAFVVVVVMLAVLLMRIIMLWLYTVLSPLVFLGFAFPPLQKYTGQIWQDFIKQVITGPMLAFFLWLALTTAGSSSVGITEKIDISQKEITGGINALFAEENFSRFIIVIGMFIGGLMVTQQVGGAVGSIAGKGMAAIQKGRGLAWSGAKGTVKGATGAVLTTASRSAGIKERLGRLGGSESLVAKFTGARSLATRSLTSLDSKKRSFEEKANQYTGKIKDTRILGRMANQAGRSSWTAALKDAARNKAPSTISDNDERERHINNMSREKLQKVNEREWAATGGTGVALSGETLDYVEKNRATRRAYNEGVYIEEGNNWVRGRDRNGNQTRDLGFDEFNYDNVADPDDIPLVDNLRYIRGARGVNANAYRKVSDEDENKARGAGNLSVQGFGKGETNTLAVDFDSLDIGDLKESVGEEFKDIKGVNVTDTGTIKKVADKMVSIIDQELDQLKSKPIKKLTDGETKKISNFEVAKERFKDSSKIDNLSMLNSSSHGWRGAKDVKESKIHEELHGYGISSEKDVEKLTQHIINTKQYSKTKDVAQEHLTKHRTVDDVIKKEKADQNMTNTDSVEDMRAFTPETKTIVNNIISSNPTSTSNETRNLAYLLLRLNKILTSQTGALNKLGKNLVGLTDIDPEITNTIVVNDIAEKIKNKFS